MDASPVVDHRSGSCDEAEEQPRAILVVCQAFGALVPDAVHLAVLLLHANNAIASIVGEGTRMQCPVSLA